MNRLFLFMAGHFLAIQSFGQLSPATTPVIDQFGVVKSMSSRPNAVAKGSVYLNEDWIISNIYLKKDAFATDKIENVPIKIDLKTNMIELNTQYGVKVLPLSKVDKFDWVNPANGTEEIYTNCNKFALNGSRLESFCMVYGNTAKLVKHNYLDIIKADYNVALNVGSKEDRVIKKEKFYLVKDDELIQFSKKSLYSVMADKEEKIRQFVKKNRVDFDEEGDLRSVLDYYNSI